MIAVAVRLHPEANLEAVRRTAHSRSNHLRLESRGGRERTADRRYLQDSELTGGTNGRAISLVFTSCADALSGPSGPVRRCVRPFIANIHQTFELIELDQFKPSYRGMLRRPMPLGFNLPRGSESPGPVMDFPNLPKGVGVGNRKQAERPIGPPGVFAPAIVADYFGFLTFFGAHHAAFHHVPVARRARR